MATLIVQAGPVECHGRRGIVYAERALSAEQVDLVLDVIERAGQTPDRVQRVELSEGRAVVLWYWHAGGNLLRATTIEAL